MTTQSLFEAFLSQYTPAAWARALDALAPEIHEVDRDATRVWFSFFPLALARALGAAEDREQLARRLLIQGKVGLREQVDASHRFLYGHRFWPRVKHAILAAADSETAPGSLDLAALIRDLARKAAVASHEIPPGGSRAALDVSLLVGITAVGVMTLQQAGVESFARRGSGFGTRGSKATEVTEVTENKGGRLGRLSPDAIVKARAKDDSQGVFGFLRGIRTEYSVTFDETRDEGSFTLINGQHLTTAAANDTRDYSADPRCFAGGPIPVECRTAACGTCWVGVIGGREKLSGVDALESRRIKEFGYIDTAEPKPHIRLACMAQASGNVTIVIPPWNGVFGKFLRTLPAVPDAKVLET